MNTSPTNPWQAALRVAALFAVDPAGLGGVVLRAPAGPVRDRWLAELRALLPATAPLLRVPLHVQDERLLGGLDLTATLETGRAVAQRGLLAEADGGVVLLAMAERVGAGTAARLAAVLDAGGVATARDGVEVRHPSRFGVVALDEGDADEHLCAALADRLACWLDLSAIAPRTSASASIDRARVDTARALLPAVHCDDEVVQALCAAACALGVASMRAPLLALRVARAAAALAGRDDVDANDASLAAQLVLGPRATQMPAGDATATEHADDTTDDTTKKGADRAADAAMPDRDRNGAPDSPTQATEPEPEARDTAAAQPDTDAAAAPPPDAQLDDVVLEAAVATVPRRLLDALVATPARAVARAGTQAGAGALQAHRHRGAPCGVRRGRPRAGERLDVIETLRAAAPWQRLRQRADAPASDRPRIAIRADDFHVTRYRQRSETTTIFVIDASGSSALHRLAEAKGAVELLLADCYVRRDSVAVIAFRGRTADVLLPPTRSLVRAKRSLAGLPGGGGTPLALALDATGALAEVVRRHGGTPLAVLLTDGRANIGRDGAPGRDRAEADATHAARRLRASRLDLLLLDTSPQPQPSAARLAGEMGAIYRPLPHAAAADLAAAVRSASAVDAR